MSYYSGCESFIYYILTDPAFDGLFDDVAYFNFRSSYATSKDIPADDDEGFRFRRSRTGSAWDRHYTVPDFDLAEKSSKRHEKNKASTQDLLLALTGCKFERKTIYAKKFEKIWSERIPKIQRVQSRKLEKPAPQRFQITAIPSSVAPVTQPLQNCTLDDLDADDLD